MKTIKQYQQKACLFCAVKYKTPEIFENVLQDLKNNWGVIAKITEEYNFSDITDYYTKEMGSPLYKRFIIFENIQMIDALHKTKIKTNQIETEYKKNSARVVNLDPGYLTEAKVVLFSTKDFYHRLYIGDGIFGEVTLSYKSKKGFIPFEWTFPDYKKIENINFFNQTRDWFREIIGRKRKKNYYKLIN